MGKVKGEMVIISFIFGFLILGSRASFECDDLIQQLKNCAEPMAHLQNVIISSTFKTVSDMLQECEIQLRGVSCVKSISRCMSKGEREVLELTTAGTQQVVEELCNDTFETHKRYMDSFDCIQNVAKESKQCDEKFQISQRKIQEEVHNERIKRFYSCCSFEWMTHCKVGIAEQLCNPETSSLVDHVVRTLHTKATSKLCQDDVSSCYDRLYGFENQGARHGSSRLVAWVLLAYLICIDYQYRN